MLDGSAQVRRHFPGAAIGTIGNDAHLYIDGIPSRGRKHGGHTPWGNYRWPKDPAPTAGIVYAIDVGGTKTFSPTKFLRWLVPKLRAGKYPEVQYVITNWELYDGAHGWRKQRGGDGPDHVHVQFRGGKYNTAHSTGFADYAASLKPAAKVAAGPAYPVMGGGYGGPEGTPAQRAWVVRWHKAMAGQSPGYYTKIIASPAGKAEVARQEIGTVTLFHARAMAEQVIGGYRWTGFIDQPMWRVYKAP